jgi:hypothetical protein
MMGQHLSRAQGTRDGLAEIGDRQGSQMGSHYLGSPRHEVRGLPLAEEMGAGHIVEAAILFIRRAQGHPECDAHGSIQGPIGVVLMPLDVERVLGGLLDHIVLKEYDFIGL